MFGENHFGVVDYIVTIVSLVTCLFVGIYYAYFSKHTNEDLLVGGRTMNVLPIAASIMVSFLSAITILGYPAEIYSFGAEIYMQTIFQGLAIVCSAYLFIPFFYPMKLTSVFEYLELRFNSIALRRFGASIFFMEQICLGSMVVYAPSVALNSFLGLPMWISIFGVGLCGTLYTSLGGLKAVVWTDAFQFVIMVIGLMGIVIKAFMEAGGVLEAFSVAGQNGRLNFFNFNFDPFQRHNFYNFFLGSGLMTIIRTGIHQLQVQRYSSLPTLQNAKRALLISAPLKVFVLTMCLLSGIAIYSANATCDPVLSKKIAKVDQIVPLFVLEHLSHIPGSMGLFTACIFSAVLSSVSSILNSLAAVTWEDFLSRVETFRNMGPRSQTNVSRLLSFLFGIITMIFAFTTQFLGPIYAASFALTGISTGALNGLFFMGIFLPFVNKIGAAAGVLASMVSIGYVSIQGFIHVQKKIYLPVSTESCPVNATYGIHHDPLPLVMSNLDDEEHATFLGSLHSLSYIMYPVFGFLIAVFTGTFVSALTGGFTQKQQRHIDPNYVHPLVIRLYGRRDSTHDDETGKEMETYSRK